MAGRENEVSRRAQRGRSLASWFTLKRRGNGSFIVFPHFPSRVFLRRRLRSLSLHGDGRISPVFSANTRAQLPAPQEILRWSTFAVTRSRRVRLPSSPRKRERRPVYLTQNHVLPRRLGVPRVLGPENVVGARSSGFLHQTRRSRQPSLTSLCGFYLSVALAGAVEIYTRHSPPTPCACGAMSDRLLRFLRSISILGNNGSGGFIHHSMYRARRLDLPREYTRARQMTSLAFTWASQGRTAVVLPDADTVGADAPAVGDAQAQGVALRSQETCPRCV
jgi:hypothetical protein